MLTTTERGELVGGEVVERTYRPCNDGAPTIVAVQFTDCPGGERYYRVAKVAYVGRTLAAYTKVERVMSDVWDNVRYVTVYTDEGNFEDRPVGDGETYTIDAPAELVARWEEAKKLAAEWAEVRKRVAAKRAAEAAAKREAATPRVGKTVRVVRGRKVPRGLTGTVVWYGAGKQYGYYGEPPYRVGIKDETGAVHWTDAKNVEVVVAEEAA